MIALPELSANIYVFVILSDFPKGIESVFSKIISPDELFINRFVTVPNKSNPSDTLNGNLKLYPTAPP